MQRTGEARKGIANAVEDAFLEIDEVHLVDGEDDIPDPEQRADKAVPLGLLQHLLAGVHQQHGQVCVRCPRHHVAGIMQMTGRIGDDETPVLCREMMIADIDRDALLALGLQPVEQQGCVGDVAGRS